MDSPKHIFYLTNGSIGDFLMTIYCMENIHANASFSKTLLHVVVPPRNFSFLKSIAKAYPFVRLHRGGVWGGMFTLRFIFSKKIVITPPTPGVLPHKTKVFGKMLSYFAKSIFVGFKDSSDDNSYYDILLTYNTKQPYVDTMQDIVRAVGGTIFKQTPTLIFKEKPDILLRHSLTTAEYIVVASYAATEGRSMKEEDILRIVKAIKEKPTGYKIVFVGSPADSLALKNVFGTHEGEIINLAGALSFSELATIIARSYLFIGVDTGTSHVAGFLGVKSIVVAHNGTPNWLPYYNKNARIIYRVRNCLHKIHEGREHMEECRGEVLRALDYVEYPHVLSVMGQIIL
jgi:ADP-heptose:LPS heptosyltransferase